MPSIEAKIEQLRYGFSAETPRPEPLSAEATASECALMSLLEHSSDGVIVADREGRFLYINSTMEELLGLNESPADSWPQHVSIYFPDGTTPLPPDEFPLARALRGETANHFACILSNPRRLEGVSVNITALPLNQTCDERRPGALIVCRDVSRQMHLEAEKNEIRRRLDEACSRLGMSEVANGVLHNVANALTSVNVAAQKLYEQLRDTRVERFYEAAQIVEAHRHDLSNFLTHDNSGKAFLDYFVATSRHFRDERSQLVDNAELLLANVDHIKEIIKVQQGVARMGGTKHHVLLCELMDSALKIHDSGLTRHRVEVVRDYRANPVVSVEPHRVLQILVNLISNAKYAASGSDRPDKRVILRTDWCGEGRVKLEVEDNGVGISREHVPKIFMHGFTTKDEGHGFGLHSSLLTAKELDATLTFVSEGEGRGAIFTLEMAISRSAMDPLAALVGQAEPALALAST